MNNDFVNYLFAAVGAFGGGFAVAFYVYHKNKVARDFQALVDKIKAELAKGNTPTV